MSLSFLKHPLLQSQLSVFIECMQYPDCTQYNLPIITPLGKDVDLDRIEKAFHVIYDSRVAWRIRFGVDEEGKPYQYDDKTKEFRVVRREMTDEEFQKYAYKGFCRPFGLMGNEPLVRVELVTTELQDYLLMDVHHLIMDGMSYTPLWSHQDLSAAYQNSSLPIETYTILDAADDEQRTLHGEAYEKAKAYYAEKYSDVDFATLSLRPANPLGKMLRVDEYVKKAEIDTWCKEHGVDVHLLFQAAFSYVMSVLLREDKIAYTTVSHGRFDKRWRKIYGMFSRAVPVMSEIKEGQTVLDYIKSFHTELLYTIGCYDYPVSHLCSDHNKDLGVTFNFFAIAEADEAIVIERHKYPVTQPERTLVTLDLNVEIYLKGIRYDIRVNSSEAVNDLETLQIVARSIAVTLQKMMQHPDAAIKSLSIVGEEEQRRLVELGTGERLGYDKSKTIIDVFREQVERAPDAIAIVYKDKIFTYKDIDQITDRFAVYLSSLGVRPEVTVGVLIDRSELMLIYPLAIMKAGGAYMPLDPTFPEERLMYMCKDAELQLILSDEGLAEKIIHPFEGKVIGASILKSLPEVSEDDLNHLEKAAPENKFVILYTSGSTGNPKGVVLEHHSILNFCQWYVHEYDMTAEDNTMAYASFGFDAHMMDIYPALTIGAKVHIIPESIRKDINALNAYMEANHITIAFMTTQLGHVFASTIENHSLRLLSVSGEKLMPLRKPSYRVFNAGAPTECTIYAFNYEIKETYYDVPVIGKPISNVNIHLVDRDMHLVPVGVAGEMVISGEGVGRGYLNLPDQNAERFITFMGQRAYRTGDLCRWNSKGQLEYIGRIDNQIKLRGYRIELGEIESAVLKLEGIKQAVALVKNDQIVLYYTGQPKSPFKEDLEGLLPSYMLPNIYVQLDAIPLTPNGKIDRKALPEPEYKSESIVLPTTKDEQDVLEVVEEMLDISPISATANLISLGLSSITAMRLSMRISQQLGKTISMSQLMASPIIRDIAANLKSNEDKNIGKVRQKQESYPLTDNQLGVYLDWEQHRDGLQYNVPVAIKLKGYDAGQLQSAISTAVAAHPYLFARLAKIDDEVMVRRVNSEKLTVNIVQLQTEPTAEFFQSRVRPFNLFEDRLFRFEIYVFNETTYLFEDIHHIITDGVSDAQLMSDIFAAYKGKMPEAEVYSAYDRALEEQEIKESTAYTEAEEYYKKLLADVESTVYPHSTESIGEGRAQYIRGILSKKVIESHCAKLGVTPSNYLLTVFMEVLKRITREDKVLITTLNSGREHAMMQDIQGFFVKTIPVISADTPAEIQSQLIESISQECYPLTEMVQTMGIHPEIMYDYEGGLFNDDRIREVKDLEVIQLSLDTVKVPLSLTVNPEKEDYELFIEYDDALYNEQDMQTLLHSIIVLAENYAKTADFDTPLSACSILNEKEEQLLAELGTGEKLEYDKSKTFIDLFKEQVIETSDAVAVVDATSQLTYKELDEASDEYANTIRRGTFVCLEIPRVKEFIVAVLGIWKAGSAYVPIDSEYPEERKKYIREECDGKPLPQADIAYMIYTSGSTGKPKGVMIQHGALLNLIQFSSTEYSLTKDSQISNHCSFSFDGSIEDLYPVLTVGGTLHILSEELRYDLKKLHDYIVLHQITGGFFSTQVGQMLLQQYPDIPLHYISIGGEKVTINVKSSCRILNTYGPTEFTDNSIYFELDQSREYDNIPIGKPLHNLSAFILDIHNHLLPVGIPGELCIAGPQIALGYYNNPDLTAERFVEVTINGKRDKIYKTGDLCRWNSEGQLEYIGRIDNQIKLRGFRIELGEIESAAMQIEGIKQTVALVKNEQIVLYYTGDYSINEDKLATSLSLSLANYMVPNVYMQLDAIPLTPNGKIDRKALPDPEYKSESIVLPATKDEQGVLEIVEEMMGISPISVTANLISLGLSSISAMRLAMHLSHQLGKTISMSQLMASPTIRDIATNLKSSDDSNYGKVRENKENYPLTDNQLGVYLDWEQHRVDLQYNVPTAIKLKGYDAKRLQMAVRDVVAAHPYLFAQLATVDGEVRIKRNEPHSYHCTVTELEEPPTTEFFQRRVRPFNLFEDRLFRFEIYTYQETTYFFEDIHHIITDGVSDANLMLEIFAAYNGEEIETETYTAFDRALEEQEIKESTAYTEAEEYYKKLLADVESTVYPHSTERIGEGRAQYIRGILSKKAIESHCIKLGVTPSNYLLTVFMEVLKRITREEKVMITAVSSGREHAMMQNIQGFFVKTLPVLSAGSPAELQRQLIESISHECYPLTEMVQTMGIHPEIMYTYEDELYGDERIRGIKDLEVIRLSLDTVKVPISLMVNPDMENYELIIEYNDALYNEQDMQALLHSIIVLAGNYANAENSDKTLQECSLLTAEEEDRLIELGIGDRLEYDKSKTFIDLFKEQVARTPDSVAVVDATSQLTYRELDIASDEYAKTVTPGTFVCVEMPRVKEFVVAVLGIWKAGSAYVPIDMEYPDERKRLMREECNGKALPQADIAYMIYTSGSTGKPKGVMIQHSAYLNYLHFYVHQQRLTSADRMACHRNFSFDASLEDLYPILSVGGELHLMPEGIRMDLSAIRQFILERRISCCSFTTSLGELLLQTYPDLPLRYMVVSGEKLNPIDNLQVPLWNFYGPTECTVDCVTCLIEPGKSYADVPIGKTVNNLTAMILDLEQRLLPRGVSGELCIAGPQLALGYYNNPELTADRFVEVTISGRKERVYKTGDLCRWNNEGQLEYIGRIDNQIKLRGFRIELGEIESAALQIEGIRQAVTLVKNDQIVLYYTSESKSLFKGDLEGLLPEYMVPSACVHLDEMPLTPNGKINRKALSEPEVEVEDITLPATKEEQEILEMLEEMMGKSSISVTANLISLGLSSLMAMKLCFSLSKRYQVEMKVNDILQNPQIRSISTILYIHKKEQDRDVFKSLEKKPLKKNKKNLFKK